MISIFGRCVYLALVGVFWFLFCVGTLVAVNGFCGDYKNAIINPSRLDALGFYSLLLDAILISPIVEELVFRKFLLGYVFRKKLIVGCLVSSIIFSVVHGFYYGQILSNYHYLILFLTGILFGWVFIRFQMIVYYSIFLHALLNLLMIYQVKILATINNMFCA